MRSLLLIGALVLGIASVSAPVNAAGVRTFVRHEVTDYAAWRSVFDQSHGMQRKMGVSYTAVYQSTDNPNDITVVSDFKTEAKAKAFAASDELKAAMQSAGVKGVPQVWFTRITPGASGKTGHVRMFVRHQVSDYAHTHQPGVRGNVPGSGSSIACNVHLRIHKSFGKAAEDANEQVKDTGDLCSLFI